MVHVNQSTNLNATSPLEALVRAIEISWPECLFTSVNVTADRPPVRKLYDLVTGDSSCFDFGVHFLGNTGFGEGFVIRRTYSHIHISAYNRCDCDTERLSIFTCSDA